MQEIELKFQIPAAQLALVRAAVQALSHEAANPLSLHAAYYDTADNALARQKMALRVRREGDEWIQTFKAAGRDAMTRIEHNQPRAVPEQQMPLPDLSLHPPEAQQALMRALPWRPADDPHGEGLGLIALYETRFERRQALVDKPQGDVIVCIDEGEILAGDLRDPLAELEMELSSGHPHALLDLARQWVSSHGIWLDVQSKAYRGTRLAQARVAGRTPSAKAVAAPSGTDDQASSDPPGCLNQVLDAAAGNWSEVATLRPGWSAALLAWRQSLTWLEQQAQAAGIQGELTAWMPADFWQATAQQIQALDALLGASSDSLITPDATRLAQQEQDSAWALAAQSLAQQASTTFWALDILQVLKR